MSKMSPSASPSAAKKQTWFSSKAADKGSLALPRSQAHIPTCETRQLYMTNIQIVKHNGLHSNGTRITARLIQCKILFRLSHLSSPTGTCSCSHYRQCAFFLNSACNWNGVFSFVGFNNFDSVIFLWESTVLNSKWLYHFKVTFK